MEGYYDRLCKKRNDSPKLQQCVENVVEKLQKNSTTSGRPGLLLGKIQSGKTMAFLGVIAKSFDVGFDLIIVLTKGTKALSAQTVSRLKGDFKEFEKSDELKIFDIMNMPKQLVNYVLRQKLIFVAKKQHQNLSKLLEILDHPELKGKRKILLIDDEADLASVRFTKNEQGRIAQQIDELRSKVVDIAFLQVTATPYALYLQPDDYLVESKDFFIFPKKPAFTELLPIHDRYIGGDDYFGLFSEEDPRFYLHVPVSPEEHDVLRVQDGRRIKKNYIMSSPNIKILRKAILNFIISVVIRRWQLQGDSDNNKKFSLIIHNDTQKQAHDWQWETVNNIIDTFAAHAKVDSKEINELFDECFLDLSLSIEANGGTIPQKQYCKDEVFLALHNDDIQKVRVNSDSDVSTLLDENCELQLWTPYNIFIGGSILDRGITIPNLIGFYYGRNPKRVQADTALQHSRMYGNRPMDDLAVTRFYTSRIVYDRLKKIHELESALRNAFEKGAHDYGVVFIQSDENKNVIPCSTEKIKKSDIYSILPGGRILPVGFQSKPKKKIQKLIKTIDEMIPSSCKDSNIPLLISTDVAHRILENISQTLEFEESVWDWNVLSTCIDYFCLNIDDKYQKYNDLYLLAYTDRNIQRVRESGRYSNAPDTKQQRDITNKFSINTPTLLLLRQTGREELGWGGYPFWWPVLVAPSKAHPCVYAGK